KNSLLIEARTDILLVAGKFMQISSLYGEI
ncbi:unnamed protein product, partial [marine sediment metagenome]